ncbi:hypothetical protein ACIBFB_26515 [Nocardiopsis sp. NPDC050513]|uniref:hypothetical protein n=1 Tax=Nocardiopsis sp. NPDC050513 TaxID=3364338 RepID=UPI0037B3C00A
MIALVIAAAVLVTIAVPVLLLAATGGPVLIHTEHELPEPARTRRAPKKEG